MILSLCQASCLKLQQGPQAGTQIGTPQVFSNDQEAEAAIAGLFAELMSSAKFPFNGGLDLYASLSADELSRIPGATTTAITEMAFEKDSLTSANTAILTTYGNCYVPINTANSIIQGLAQSTGVSALVKARLSGDAFFIRALSYFYLVNLFGNVPLVTGTNFSTNAALARSVVSDVNKQILADLQAADSLLPADYVDLAGNPTTERVYPNRYAAEALLARQYLFLSDWIDAERMATAVIENPEYQLDSDLTKVFMAGSPEAIWQLEPVSTRINTEDGSIFIPPSPLATPTYYLDTGLIHAFEPNDNRVNAWTASVTNGSTKYVYPYKYKVVQGGPPYKEYNMVMRLAEQYLIRAEARAEQNEFGEGLSDLNLIRQRAGLAGSSASDLPSLLAAIMQERRVELFTEWGHRWLDLKRTGLAVPVLNLAKPGWLPTDTLYPIPSSDLQLDPQLNQNPGYD